MVEKIQIQWLIWDIYENGYISSNFIYIFSNLRLKELCFMLTAYISNFKSERLMDKVPWIQKIGGWG